LGASSLGVQVPLEAAEGLFWLGSELLRWNMKVNLTAIVDPIDVLDKHILDSLGASTLLAKGTRTLLDVGTGAGFPGLPLALVHPSLEVWLVEARAKKVGFLKHAVAGLGLGSRVRPVHATLAKGARPPPGLPPVDSAISRAFRDIAGWAELATGYVRPGGQLLAMAGGGVEASVLPGWGPPEVRRFQLPSGAGRTVLSYGRLA